VCGNSQAVEHSLCMVPPNIAKEVYRVMKQDKKRKVIEEEHPPAVADFEGFVDNVHNAKLEDLEELAHFVVDSLNQVKEGLENQTPEGQEKVIQKLKDLQLRLDQEAEKANVETGMSAEEMRKYVENKDNFSPEQWAILQKTKADLKVYQETLLKAYKQMEVENNESAPSKKKKPPKKTRKGKRERAQWIPT